jgi:hypothetical protein
VTRPVEDLRPHPSYARHQFTVSASKLSALIEQRDLAFQEPLVISVNGTIIDGYGLAATTEMLKPYDAELMRRYAVSPA